MSIKLSATNEEKIAEARKVYGGDDIEIDDNAKFSEADDEGVWVAAWVWLRYEDDEDEDEDEDEDIEHMPNEENDE